MFDKEAYWARRNNTVTTGKGKNKVVTPAPLRGQGDPIKPKVMAKIPDDPHFASGSHMVHMGGKFAIVNRQQSRRG